MKWLILIPIVLSALALDQSVNGNNSIASRLINRSNTSKQKNDFERRS